MESYAEYLMTESGISEPEESQVQTALLSGENGNDNREKNIYPQTLDVCGGSCFDGIGSGNV